jgi:hypothetical protein
MCNGLSVVLERAIVDSGCAGRGCWRSSTVDVCAGVRRFWWITDRGDAACAAFTVSRYWMDWLYNAWFYDAWFYDAWLYNAWRRIRLRRVRHVFFPHLLSNFDSSFWSAGKEACGTGHFSPAQTDSSMCHIHSNTASRPEAKGGEPAIRCP